MAAMVSEKTVGSTPTSTPPISQSMDGHSASSRYPGDSSSDSPAHDALDRSPSTLSPSRQLDPQSQLLSRVEEYRQLFRLPPDEVLVQDFNCALQENFLLQGHMYLFVHCICFYSNLFGFETKKIIPFNEVTSVRRAKAVAVFPTAIEIIAGEKKYFFTSFLSRDEAFRLINDGWMQHTNGSKEINGLQEPNSDITSQAPGSPVVEELNGSCLLQDDTQNIESDRNGHISEDSNHFGDGEPEIASTSSVSQVRMEENAKPAQNIQCPSTSISPAWGPEDADAPGVPECYTKVAETKFPIHAEEFFNLFFSDDGVNFQESFHRKCGDKDFKCSTWRTDEKFGHTRDVSFQHPIKIYFGARFGSCQEVQKYRVYRNSHLIIDTSQDISDVPYGDYFSVEGRWDVENDNNGSTAGCKLRVYTNVAFSKKTMWKGKIVQSTVEECREAYESWIDLAHEVLKQKNLEKEEGDRASNLILNKQVQSERLVNIQNSMEIKSSGVGLAQIIPDQTRLNQRVTDPQLGIASEASIGSIVGDIFSKFSTSLKLRNTPTLLLVITLAVILILMQISILVLLSRPQRIHLVPQMDYTSSMHSESRAEGIASLNKQIRYLKEEMHFMEVLLEKMQNDYALLKRNLKDLELYRNQRM